MDVDIDWTLHVSGGAPQEGTSRTHAVDSSAALSSAFVATMGSARFRSSAGRHVRRSRLLLRDELQDVALLLLAD